MSDYNFTLSKRDAELVIGHLKNKGYSLIENFLIYSREGSLLAFVKDGSGTELRATMSPFFIKESSLFVGNQPLDNKNIASLVIDISPEHSD